MAKNDLTSAKKAKMDEFYTRWEDIENEVNSYIEFNPSKKSKINWLHFG